MEALLRQLLETYPRSVKLVVKHFPLRSHRYAKEAAMAAMAANEQGEFWPFHAALLENHRSLNNDKVQEIAQELGLDMSRFEKDRRSAAIQQHIIDDVRNGREVGVRGTPTIFINGKRVANRDFANLPKLIEAELAAK